MKHAEKLIAAVHEACGSDTVFPSRYREAGSPIEVIIYFDRKCGYDRVTMESGRTFAEERIAGQNIQEAIRATVLSIAPESAVEKLAVDGQVSLVAYEGGIILTSYVSTVGGRIVTKVRVLGTSVIQAVIWQPNEGRNQFLVPDTQHEDEEYTGSWADPHGDYDEESYLASLENLKGEPTP